MFTPTLYQMGQIRKISKIDKFSVFHWTTEDKLKSILNDSYIYSAGMSFALKEDDLWSRNRTSHKDDAEHGFIDYVFLGTSNWASIGRPSFYGDVGIELSFLSAAEGKEFFIFPFNTGYYFSKADDSKKLSDISALKAVVATKPHL